MGSLRSNVHLTKMTAKPERMIYCQANPCSLATFHHQEQTEQEHVDTSDASMK